MAAATLTCGGDLSEPPPPPAASAIQEVSGDNQSAPAGSPLPAPLVVVVTNDDDGPVADVTVTWEAHGGGSVSAATSTTNAEGRASVQRTLGPTAGSQSTTGSVTGLTGSPVTFSATATTVGQASITVATQPPASVLDGEVFAPEQQPAVRLLDAAGSPMAGQAVSATISAGGATLAGATSVTTDANGVAAFGDLGIQGTGSYAIGFTAGALHVESNTIAVNALPAEATTGRWWAPVAWPIVPLHIHLLPTGNVLAWGRQDQPWVWSPPAGGDPAGTGGFIEVPVDTMLFCAGHAFMADGRLMVSGGHLQDDRGIQNTYFFTASGSAGSWDNAGGALMARGRWYPTVTILPDGRALTVAGRDSASGVVGVPEVWNGSRWVSLPGADKKFPYYPRTFVASNGRVFYAGEQIQSWWLDVAANGGAGAWTTGPAHLWKYNRDYGSAVMYDDDKVMYVGGGGDPKTNSSQGVNDPKSSVPTNTAEIIDLRDAAPTWRSTGSMAFRRRHHTATALPDGQVLVTGGVSGGGELNNLSAPTQAAEIWSPETGTWTTLASNAVPRGYHAVSLLMPNGLVLHGASGDANRPDGSAYPRQMSHEMFSPPYLFKGNRPTIASAPATVSYGQSFLVETPYAKQISKVTWIRLPSVTHAFDANQRLNTLAFSLAPNGVNVTAPPSANHAPPGHYVLFVLNRNGVPSAGKIIRIQ